MYYSSISKRESHILQHVAARSRARARARGRHPRLGRRTTIQQHRVYATPELHIRAELPAY